jgi:tetratricopeptide (TPR) repeat protein
MLPGWISTPARRPGTHLVALALGLVLAGPFCLGACLAAELDPVAQADALLADASRYDEAVGLYRAALDQEPGRSELRLRLAKVLSWQGEYDASLAEFDRLLASPAAPEDARVLRAEVLSWAGRSDEARAAFEALLVDAPDDPRALRGLARVHSWAGHKLAAREVYMRALAMEEDPEARKEFDALSEGSRPRLTSATGHFHDNDGFRRTHSHGDVSYAWNHRTRVALRLGFLSVRTNAPGVQNDRGYETGLRVERRLGESLLAQIDLGGRFFEEHPSRERVSAALRYTTPGGTALAAELDHRDALDRTDSAVAMRKGIRDTRTRVTLWRELFEDVSVFASAQGAALSDSNARHASSAAFDWKPFEGQPFSLHLGGGYSSYSDDSPNYYAPSIDTSARLGMRHKLSLPSGLTLALDVGGGYGYAKENGEGNAGPSYDLWGSLTWASGPYRLTARGGRSLSQRGSAYIAEHLGLELGAEF